MTALMNLPCIAFEDSRCVARGPLKEVALAIRQGIAHPETAPILIFDDKTSAPVEVDFRGTGEEVLARLAARDAEATQKAEAPEKPEAKRGRGRPKLGVVSREITLLPRHWEWLANQPGGASVALRKLVEAARRTQEPKDRMRQAQDAAYRFLSTMAGNLPHFEEVLRALYGGDPVRLTGLVETWPADIRAHTLRLVERCGPTS